MFAAVLKAMRLVDWAFIAFELADRYGPVSEPDIEDNISTLRRNILEMDREAEADRAH